MNLQILSDALLGGGIVGIFSYMSSLYEEKPEYIKIIAFLWGIPLIFFYLLFIAWKNGESAAIAFTKHALFGAILTIVSMWLTIYMHKSGKYPTILANIGLLSLYVIIYFTFKLYRF
jgi:inner membrane protein involved in colicin E2 resistance